MTLIKLRLRRMGWIILLITILSVAGAVIMQKFDLFGVEGQELSAYDGGLNFWTKNPQKSKNVAMVLISDASFAQIEKWYPNFGAWPYDREIWAHILQYLQDCQVKAVAFDIVFTESKRSDELMLQQIRQLTQAGIPFVSGFDTTVDQLELPNVKPQNRWLYKEVSEQIQKDLDKIYPIEYDENGFPKPKEEKKETNEELVKRKSENTKKEAPIAPYAVAYPIFASGFSLPQVPPLEEIDPKTGKTEERPYHPHMPMSSLWPIAQFGLVSAEFDLERNQDGKMRYTSFGHCDSTNCYANLSVVTVASLLKADSVQLTPGSLTVGRRKVKINPNGTAGINYGGSWRDRFSEVDLFYILDDQIQRAKLAEKGPMPPPKFYSQLKDKVVLVALGKFDNQATPFEKEPPAVVKHAAEIDNLLETGFMVDAPYFVSFILALMLAWLSILIILTVESAFLELGWPILLFFGFYVIPGYFLVKYQIHILSIMPSLAGSMASVLASVYKNFFAEQDRTQLRDLFSRYMEKDVVEHMVEQRQLPNLEGEEKEITIFFCEIAQFDQKIEKAQIDLKTRMKILNLYLEKITEILVKEGACIDKYVEHEVRALFGTPIFYPDHALRACRAALLIKEAFVVLQQECKEQGWPLFEVHIGINTDQVLVGNVGSKQLIDYTAIGEGVEFAAWLEKANKTYQTSILIGPKTFEQTQSGIQVGQKKFVSEFGSQKEVPIYECTGVNKVQLPSVNQRSHKHH